MHCLVNGITTFYPYWKIKLDPYLIVYIAINSRQIKCLNVKDWYNYFCEETDNNYRDPHKARQTHVECSQEGRNKNAH